MLELLRLRVRSENTNKYVMVRLGWKIMRKNLNEWVHENAWKMWLFALAYMISLLNLIVQTIHCFCDVPLHHSRVLSTQCGTVSEWVQEKTPTVRNFGSWRRTERGERREETREAVSDEKHQLHYSTLFHLLSYTSWLNWVETQQGIWAKKRKHFQRAFSNF